MAPKIMIAKFPGKCSACSGKIAPGEQISWRAGHTPRHTEQISWRAGHTPRHTECPSAANASALPAPVAVAPAHEPCPHVFKSSGKACGLAKGHNGVHVAAKAVIAAAVEAGQAVSATTIVAAEAAPKQDDSLAKRYAFLAEHGVHLHGMSTDECVRRNAGKIQAAIDFLLRGEGVMEIEARADMIADLQILLRRVPDARVSADNVSDDEQSAADKKSRERLRKRILAALHSDTGYVAVADGAQAGAYVWRTASGEANLDALAAAWEAAELSADMLPSARTLGQVCRRAIDKARRGQGERVRIVPVVRGSEWAVIVEQLVADGEGGRMVPGKPETLLVAYMEEKVVKFRDVSERGAALRPAVEAALVSGAGVLSPDAVSAWVTDLLARHCGGQRLRREGGFYYVPPQHLELIGKIKAALEACTSFRLMRTPVTKCADVVEAVASGTRLEFDAIQEEIAKALADGSKGGVALDNLEADALALRGRLAGMERMMGFALGDMRDKMQAISGAITARIVEVQSAKIAAEKADDEGSKRVALVVAELAAEEKGVVAPQAPEAEEQSKRFSGAVAEAERPVTSSDFVVVAEVFCAPAPVASPLVEESSLCGRACQKYGAAMGILRYFGVVMEGAVNAKLAADAAEAERAAKAERPIELDDRTGTSTPLAEVEEEGPGRRVDLN